MIYTLRTNIDCDSRELTETEILRYDETTDTNLDPITITVVNGIATDDEATTIDFEAGGTYVIGGESYSFSASGIELVGG